MKKFKVYLERIKTTDQSAQVEVEAEDEESACKKAQAMVDEDDVDWNDGFDDYSDEEVFAVEIEDEEDEAE